MTWRPATRSIAGWMLSIALAFPHPLFSQESTPPPATLEDALHQMSDLAGIIFVGQVLAVRHLAGDQGSSGVVEIDFHIEQAVRGCSSSITYTLREWAGLWQEGDNRYRPGQRLLMLLHTPNAAGLSSPVGGTNGAIPIRSAAAPALVTSSATVSPSEGAPISSTPLVADLRWIGTRVLRSTTYASAPAGVTAQSITATKLTEEPQSSRDNTTSISAEQASVSVVVGLLGTWEQSSSR